MNAEQRKSFAKYFYDISKGVILLAVVTNLLQEKWSIKSLLFGIVSSIALLICAYLFERNINHD